MSVETSMYNNINSSFQPNHLRSRSFNEILNKFKQSITSEQNRLRIRKRSYSDLLKGETDSPSDNVTLSDSYDPANAKRSRTAPPQSPSPVASIEKEVRTSRSLSDDIMNTFDKPSVQRTRSLSPTKKPSGSSSTCTSPSLSPNLANGSQPQSKAITDPVPQSSTFSNASSPTVSKAGTTQKSNITLPSFSDVIRENVRQPIAPTTSLDYFDTYKPNDENWRYGLIDSMKSKNYNTSNYTLSSPTSTRPVFDSKISKPVLPPISLERERKINFPYESNYTYLNKTYLTDVERYPEYLELAQTLVNLSNSYPPGVTQSPQHSVAGLATYGTSPTYTASRRVNNLPPLYPYQLEEQQRQQNEANQTRRKLEEELKFEQQQREQRAFEQQQQQYIQTQQQYPSNGPYYQSYQPYPYVTSPSASAFPNVNNGHPGYINEQPKTPPKKHTKFIPITPPSSKAKHKNEAKSPKSNHPPRVCISCGSDQSPCWRPSWSSKEGQLCNSCGLRYKKTSARCLNDSCRKIPAKGEWSLMQTKGVMKFDNGSEGYGCLECGSQVEVKK